MKKYLLLASLLFSAAFAAYAQTGTWSGQLAVQGTPLTLVFHLDGDEPTMDSPDQAAMGIPIQVERGEMGKITLRIPMLGASFEGQWLAGRIIGSFRQMTFSAPLTLTPEKPLNRPQTPKGPFPYATEEVSFTNGDALLTGTLVLPEGYSRKTPVLIMVTGSGQEDRDETVFDHKPFAVIADALGRAGIATLRYDDRGVGGSTGDVLNATTVDFKDDALAGIRLLRERFDKVGVIGHSEGGTIALMLAAEKQADFIVSLAGMAVSGLETIVAQSRSSLIRSGYTDDQVLDSFCDAVRQAGHVRVHGGRMPLADELDLPDELKQTYLQILQQIQVPWMIKFLSLDMRPLLGDITCPVLAVNGTKDIQVDYESNLGALRNGLPANPKNRIEAVEGLNHLFQHCTTGDISEYRKTEETIAPEVLETMVKWLSGFKTGK